MARFKHPQVCTANHLLSGEVVYLTADFTWAKTLDEAAVADTPEAAQELLAKGVEQQEIISGAYLADVKLNTNGKPEPVHFREEFRTRGPSNYFHGKQAKA